MTFIYKNYVEIFLLSLIIFAPKWIWGNHQLGGTRMGFNDTESVVDKNLKVHNINNLYINGSSVFRTGGHCHPTYTIVKLSLRLADHLTNVKN